MAILPIIEEPESKRSKKNHDDGARLADADAQPVNQDLTTSTREQVIEDIVLEMRLNPPSVPSWTSEAQHHTWCDCEECADHFHTLAIEYLAPSSNGFD